jgi:serine/threonine protein kinase
VPRARTRRTHAASVVVVAGWGGVAGAATERDARGYSAYRADIWSMGICLYCFLCGQLPFAPGPEGGPPLEALVQTTEPREHALLQPVHYDLLSRLLTKQPALRATLPDAKAHAWTTDGGRLPVSQGAIVRQEVTEDDIRNSIVKIISFRVMMRVLQAVRRFRGRTVSDGGHFSASPSAPGTPVSRSVDNLAEVAAATATAPHDQPQTKGPPPPATAASASASVADSAADAGAREAAPA